MTVVQTVAAGGPEVLVSTVVPRPVPVPTEVLVRVHAAGVNPVDWKIRGGVFPSGALGAHPFTQGWDVAGVVEAGPRVTRFQPGDEVFGLLWFPRQAGGYGEYVTAPARQFARKPESLSFTEAAALPMAGLTAWQTLVDVAGIGEGSRVLITAAAGGVGHLACQVARSRGAVVTGTASAAKHDFLASVGVHEAVDYTRVEVGTAVRDQDVVLDLLGGDHTLGLLDTLRPGGLLVLTIGQISPEVAAAAKTRGVRVSPFLVEPDSAGLEALTALVERDALRVHVDHVLPLAEAGKAHELGETNRTTGKIVLSVTGT
ncbi:NADP-dependent oxidoreductase [Actinokineospora cianjurensis]|uniref:NADPH:quinone reductase-like Zn-dependent oxidoreductase n=1 Tax=Actinokineospora cianjurensis TaxID=585224 RepID=A0A421AZ66_9PSEU|nr:NADP-dependent oxidoreductase [Actinokineospora cianjurensis]RLK55091.1 NADPH:quinone reductase-like Zn-dependent oxidoreductase [Actinokineospora cianjurensis]